MDPVCREYRTLSKLPLLPKARFAPGGDEPPPEVRAAGHDRCIVPIKRENVDAWLCPDPASLAALQAILGDRERPCHEHRLAV